MDIRIKFKPQKHVVRGYKNTLHAARFVLSQQVTSSYSSGSLRNGSVWSQTAIDKKNGEDFVVVYNVETFKRGKYRKNYHHVVYIYRIPVSLLELTKIKISQYTRNFTIEYEP